MGNTDTNKEKCDCGTNMFYIVVDRESETILPKCVSCGEIWSELDYK